MEITVEKNYTELIDQIRNLLVYHRILKCFVLVDLKRGEMDYQDVGQMKRYA